MRTINCEIDERAKTLSEEYQSSLENYTCTVSLTDAARTDKDHAEASLKNHLTAIRSSLAIKVTLINQAYTHYSNELQLLNKARNYQPSTPLHPPQAQINQLSIEMTNLLKFEPISRKKARMESDYQSICNKLKDEVKKVKLKISLTELQINEAQKKSAKKSVKYCP